MDIEIRREEGPTSGLYVAKLEGEKGEMTYRREQDDLVVIERTEVAEALRGRGVGEALVERGVSDAREEGRRIKAECPYARKQIERHPEWREVLA